MSDCIFCQIVAGDAPCDLVHEDELTVTFMDLFPVGRGHLLVVPKAHAENLFEIPEPALEQVMRNTRCLALALREVFSPDGIGVHQLNGAAAGQTVFHYHVHLIPRMQGVRALFTAACRATPPSSAGTHGSFPRPWLDSRFRGRSRPNVRSRSAGSKPRAPRARPGSRR